MVCIFINAQTQKNTVIHPRKVYYIMSPSIFIAFFMDVFLDFMQFRYAAHSGYISDL